MKIRYGIGVIAAIAVGAAVFIGLRGVGNVSGPLRTELIVHRYVPAGEPVYFRIRGAGRDWKHPHGQDVPLPLIAVRINGQEYQSGSAFSPLFDGTGGLSTANLYTRQDGRRKRVALPPGTYRATVVHKNVFGYAADRPEEIVSLGDIESNEAIFEVVSEMPDDYFQPITKKDWPSILEQCNIRIVYHPERYDPDNVYLRIRGQMPPFALCFDVFLQPEGSAEEFFTGRFTVAGNPSAWPHREGHSYSFSNGFDGQNITIEQLAAGRHRLILRPSVAAAMQNPPIREFYGDVYKTDYMTIQPYLNDLTSWMWDAGFRQRTHRPLEFLPGQPYWAIDLDDSGRIARDPQTDWPGHYDFVRDPQDDVYRLNPAGGARAIRLDAVRIDAALEEFRERLEQLDDADGADIDIRPSEQPQYVAVKSDQGAVYLVVFIVTDQSMVHSQEPGPRMIYGGRYDEQAAREVEQIVPLGGGSGGCCAP